jgi:hypothetical protein
MITTCKRPVGAESRANRRKPALRWVPMALLLAVMAGPAHAQTAVFDNFNIYAVSNGPTAPTTFTLAGTTQIAQLITYHWNNGLGAQPGTISLVTPGGLRFGPYLASGVPGQNNVQNAAWVANIVGLVLPAGTYTVVDSQPWTWAQNVQSGYRGFARVYGSATSGTCTVGCGGGGGKKR